MNSFMSKASSSFRPTVVEQNSYQVLLSGGWTTVLSGSSGNMVEINNSMNNIAIMYPNSRIRVINQNGSIVDIR